MEFCGRYIISEANPLLALKKREIIMSLSWDSIVEDEWSRRSLLRLNDESLIVDALTKVSDEIRLLDLERDLILNIHFHVESSIIYIYPCHRNDIKTEVKVKYMLQLCFLFEAFDKIESKYYRDDEFYNIEHEKLVRQYLNYVYPEFNKALKIDGLEIIYSELGRSDDGDLVYVEVELPH